jgi:DNA polymerase
VIGDDVHFDIETRSRIDLTEVGAGRYGDDPTTEIFMGAVAENRPDAPVYLWINPKFENAGIKSEPKALELLQNAKRVYCHNAPFEQPVCHGAGFPVFIPLDKFRCTQAMARMAGLPESLEKCGEALDIDSKKDRRGKDLIKLFSIPDEDTGLFREPKDHPQAWAEFCSYCKQDVRAEREIHRELSSHFELAGTNLDTFQFTMRMNDLGIPVNVVALKNAQKILDGVNAGAVVEFREITGYNLTQRAKVLAWLQAGGVDIKNMQSETLLALDQTKLDPLVGYAVKLYCQLSYAATKKVQTMLDWACADGRMRGVLKFYGAGTGRWSAGGPQIQNAKKPTPAMRPITHAAFRYIHNGGTAEGLRAVYGEPVEVIASCIRHFVGHPEKPLLDGDYNAIEARVLCWLANEVQILRMWRDGRDLYKFMASQIYGVPENQIAKDSAERDMGKRTELGCGYGMGAPKFQSTCLQYKVACDEELAQRAVDIYRSTHPYVVNWWKQLDSAVRAAIQYPNARHYVNSGQPFGICIWTEITAGLKYLFIALPSGRQLAYPSAQIEPSEDWGTQITYWGQLPLSVQWGNIKLYGGKIAENITQAVAADIMSFGARAAEAKWMLPFALIHDQGLAELCEGQSATGFSAAMASLPQWARGLPLKVESKITPFYSK